MPYAAGPTRCIFPAQRRKAREVDCCEFKLVAIPRRWVPGWLWGLFSVYGMIGMWPYLLGFGSPVSIQPLRWMLTEPAPSATELPLSGPS